MTRTRSAALLATVMFVAQAASARPPAAEDRAPRAIGRIGAFWQNRPMVDRWLAQGGGLEGRTPKHMTLVRFLGGWNRHWTNGEVVPGTSIEDYDLAYRGDDGRIRYRWHLAKRRLDPYLAAGCGITIVLDNTPYCFKPDTGNQNIAHYGNTQPPTSYEEWGAFIEALCRQLVEFYGSDRVNQWRFRMGTEARFSGTQEEFHKHYDFAAAAVKRVLPGAKFGPYNYAGPPNPSPPKGGKKAHLSLYKLIDHCLNEPNHATGKVGSPVDFIACSLYSIPKVRGNRIVNVNPQERGQGRVDDWNQMVSKWPQLAGATREVHEFGILTNEFGTHGEAGARLDTWHFHTIMTLREGGMDRIYLWGYGGWLFSILDHTVGADAYSLAPVLKPVEQDVKALPADLEAIATYRRPQGELVNARLSVKSVAFVNRDRTFIITSAFHDDRFATEPVDVTVTLPASLLPSAETRRIGYTAMTRTGSKDYRIRQDLAEAGLLDKEYAAVPGLLGSRIAGPRGSPAQRFVARNSPKYDKIEKDLLTFKPFEGRAEGVDDGQRLTFRMAPPSVMVIVIDSGDDVERTEIPGPPDAEQD